MSKRSLIVEMPVLSQAQCDDILERLNSMRPHWTARAPGFSTLGKNAYQDASPSESRERDYYTPAKQSNQLLQEQFGDLLETVLRTIEIATGKSASYEHNLALPGFHIWEGRSIPRTGGHAHADLQYMHLRDGAFNLRDAESVLSFTLPIAVPHQGSGLTIWDCDARQLGRSVSRGVPRDEIIGAAPSRYVGYSPGSIYLHSGHQVHQIAGTEHVQEADVRVTFQGHGYLRRGQFYLYW